MKAYNRLWARICGLISFAIIYSGLYINPLIGQETLNSPYFGIVPTKTPIMVGPDIISTGLETYNGTFSPDGREFFYTIDVGGKSSIVYTKLGEDNSWSKPEIATFSGTYSEYDPLFSPDGSKLLFSSERPIGKSEKRSSTNIWSIERTEKGWAEPQLISLSEQGDYYSSCTDKGDIYFNIWNTGKIMKATKQGDSYLVEPLPEPINGSGDVGDPFISPNDDYLIFRGYFKKGYGRGDLYISFKIDGTWTNPENLGEKINSAGHEICPYVTSDGNLFIYSSDKLEKSYSKLKLDEMKKKYQSTDNGNSNIYSISADFIQRMRAEHD